MLTDRRLSVMLITVVLTFVTLLCSAQDHGVDWITSALPIDHNSFGPDSMVVDTEGVVHMFHSTSNWYCWGNPEQGWQIEYINDDIVCLDITTEEDETHAAFITSEGKVFYQWRKPGKPWHRELIETFQPQSIERVEIEKAPDGNLWLAVLFNDRFYLYGHTDLGWTDYIVETMPAQFKDQSLWRLELDRENQLHLVRQISPIGFYHISGTPDDWTYSIINNIEEFPGATREFELKGMEMRKDNSPIIHVAGKVPSNESPEYFCGAIFNNQGDWEAAESWSNYYGETAYDYARDRIHCIDTQGFDDGRYWSVPLSDDSRECFIPQYYLTNEGVCCITIGKLDLPHLVVWNGGYFDYHRPISDIYIHVEQTLLQDDSMVNFGYSVTNWKWSRDARVGFVMEIAGNYYWWPDWNAQPDLPNKSFEAGKVVENLLLVPAPNGAYGLDVTFYAALLHPTQDVLLNYASWEMRTVKY